MKLTGLNMVVGSLLLAAVVAVGGCREFSVDLAELSALDSDSAKGANEFLVTKTDPVSPEEVDYSYDGVDILLVVDNSTSMEEEQALLSSAVYTMMSTLIAPLPGWPYPAVESVRVGVVSSDLGLQFGVDGELPDNVTVGGCEGWGDDGLFMAGTSNPIELTESIRCDVNTGVQCPVGWICVPRDDDLGICVPGDGNWEIDCSSVMGGGFFESVKDAIDRPAVATEVACTVSLGIDGCGIEQQLKAGVRGVQQQLSEFVRDDAFLAVFVLTDEDDCSIENPALFDTPEFSQPSALMKLNVACSVYPGYLTDVADIRQQLIQLKGGDHRAVVFGALAGVPLGTICEGAGHEIGQCLDRAEMQYVETQYEGSEQYFLAPACERHDALSGDIVTSAVPGRRYVELAEEFAEYGFVFSICNNDYNWIMEEFSNQVLRAISGVPLDGGPSGSGDGEREEFSDPVLACSLTGAPGAHANPSALVFLALLGAMGLIRRRSV